jgi:predicted N-acetyltransferase YhbS
MPDVQFTIEPRTPADLEAILRLNEHVFGPGRFARTAYRIRENAAPDERLCFVAWVGSLLVGSNEMTPILIDSAPAYLLGPLIVEPVFRSQGIGEALVNRTLEAAGAGGAALTILVGDPPFYKRMGFAPVPAGKVWFPGPVDPARILYFEHRPGALEGVSGVVRSA